MKLWLLKLVDVPLNPYDVTLGMVMRASTGWGARWLAHEESYGDEGKDVWLDPERTSCEQLTENGPPGVILVNYNAG